GGGPPAPAEPAPPAHRPPRHERAFQHGPREPGVASDHQPGLGGPVVLEQGGHELAAEPEGQLGGERRLVGETANPVGAEEAAHERADPRTRRTRDGLIRKTVTPGGTLICSGSTRTVTSPGLAPVRLTRALTRSGPRRRSVPRSPWSWTSTLSGRSPITSRPSGIPLSSSGTATIRSDFSEVITNAQSTMDTARASSFSSQCRVSALTCGATPAPAPTTPTAAAGALLRARAAPPAGAAALPGRSATPSGRRPPGRPDRSPRRR